VIPLVDVKAQYRGIKPEIDEAIARVLESGQFVLGDEVAAFEREFAAYSGAAHGVGVSSGTAALHLALVAADIGPGDEVITVPFTFVASVAAITYTGATPVLVDVDPDSLTLNPEGLAAAITPRTKAIVPVHLYGQPADMDPIIATARARNLVVIEDAAQAHGARYRRRPVGSVGDATCFSFYPSKNLGACGEGGIVLTNRTDIADRVRLLRSWGERARYHHDIPAFNARLQGLQGAILRVKLRHLESWTERRRAHAARYGDLLADAGLVLPVERSGDRHVYHLYTVRSRERDALGAALAAEGIETGLHYPIPVHLQPAYTSLGYARGAFPIAEQAAAEVLSLPLFPEMTDTQVVSVAAAVARALSSTATDAARV
jgi:dTDP-4-amino-4,6-dideoxygalactose transaminase